MAANLANKQISVEEIKKATMTRGTLYRVLSRGFSLEIDEAYLEWLVLLEPTIKQLAAHIDNKDFKKGSEALDNFVKSVKLDYEKDKSGFLLSLAAEYASLFLNVGPKPVYLVESVYLGKEPLLYEEPYFDVVQNLPALRFQEESVFQRAGRSHCCGTGVHGSSVRSSLRFSGSRKEGFRLRIHEQPSGVS